MATTTPNFGWPVPTSTDYVKDGAVAIEALGDAIDATVFGLGSPGVLQVLSTTKTDSFSTSSTSRVDITGLTLSITPSSTSSKILIMSNLVYNGSTANDVYIYTMRNSTDINISTGWTNNQTFFSQNTSAYLMTTTNILFLDSPSTTSAVTYKLQTKTQTGTVNFGRVSATSDFGSTQTFTLMEVAG
jgi:hypothetical protein